MPLLTQPDRWVLVITSVVAASGRFGGPTVSQ